MSPYNIGKIQVLQKVINLLIAPWSRLGQARLGHRVFDKQLLFKRLINSNLWTRTVNCRKSALHLITQLCNAIKLQQCRWWRQLSSSIIPQLVNTFNTSSDHGFRSAVRGSESSATDDHNLSWWRRNTDYRLLPPAARDVPRYTVQCLAAVLQCCINNIHQSLQWCCSIAACSALHPVNVNRCYEEFCYFVITIFAARLQLTGGGDHDQPWDVARAEAGEWVWAPRSVL